VLILIFSLKTIIIILINLLKILKFFQKIKKNKNIFKNKNLNIQKYNMIINLNLEYTKNRIIDDDSLLNFYNDSTKNEIKNRRKIRLGNKKLKIVGKLIKEIKMPKKNKELQENLKKIIKNKKFIKDNKYIFNIKYGITNNKKLNYEKYFFKNVIKISNDNLLFKEISKENEIFVYNNEKYEKIIINKRGKKKDFFLKENNIHLEKNNNNNSFNYELNIKNCNLWDNFN